jgi:preprotein translocase subunit SecE
MSKAVAAGKKEEYIPVKAETPRVYPAQFVRNVKSEIGKVTWPTRKETAVTTLVVFIMVFLASVFFFAVDQLLSYGIRLVLGFGG